ncbi:semaphorin-4A [Eublepharis macularius]|uniref:Semaphorin-4A n=1 Tax=Eublepharis macularius TaxID=481883 RepID=A0AA97JZM0_EUBMA|nr:semaphorin-4A [Eublepharis macularius]XP_054848248.1 semaphorin-4A [Eublepharis macularius]
MKPSRPFCFLGCLLVFTAALAADLVPRVTIWTGDPNRIIPSFTQDGVLNYDIFLLSPDGETLYVGARDAILSLDIRNTSPIQLKGLLPWKATPEKKEECDFKQKSLETDCFNFIRVLVQLNDSHLYTCGTYAFSPTCAYIELEDFSLVTGENKQPLFQKGKGLCPYDPNYDNTAIVVDGELYTGTMNNFQGNEPIITRTLGDRVVLKSDFFFTWLNADADFVASFNIPSPPDDDKVYFFFSETGEYDFFDKMKVSRVARVCKNDVGGDKVLQKKWTTFLKAQLSCSHKGEFPYNVIQHIVAVQQQGGVTVFYGIFASQWRKGNLRSSAICVFNFDTIKQAFEGKFKEFNKDCSQWMTYNGPNIDPRPGSCSVGPSADRALTFIKEHFLMDKKILPDNNQPLLVKQNVQYTRITVHQTSNIVGDPYTVMFLGTDNGFLHKVVVTARGTHIIEEIQLFEEPEPVRNLLLSPEKGTLYVGYSKGVLQVPLANCSMYRSCAECVLARDPYCAWNRHRHECAQFQDMEDLSNWLQDIKDGNPGLGCQNKSKLMRTLLRSMNDVDDGVVKTLTSSLNSMVRLTCPHASALANYTWNYPTDEKAEGLVIKDDKALVVIVQKASLGTYECVSSENGYQQVVASYRVLTPKHPDILGSSNKDGIAEEGLPHQAMPAGKRRSYWVQFVTVTVLLSMTLAIAVAFAFFTYHDRLKAKNKVQGSNTPESSKAAGQPKGPLNSSPSPPQGNEYQMQGPQPDTATGPKPCCVQLEGAFQVIDVDNNRLNSTSVNEDDSKRAVAVGGV